MVQAQFLRSDSEDKTIRVWDATKRSHLLTYRREDRFWILAAHPEVNLVAAGHDSGLLVFKLERERPAYVQHGSELFYIKERYLRRHNINSASDVPFACLKRAPSLQATIRSMALVHSERERMLLLTVGPTDSPTYEIYVFPAQSRGSDSLDNVDPIRGSGVAAAFVARNKVAILDRSKQVPCLKHTSLKLHTQLFRRSSSEPLKAARNQGPRKLSLLRIRIVISFFPPP
jgi:coatomer protein complex subunit alpha (xenin)